MKNKEKTAELFNTNYDLDVNFGTIETINSCGTTCLFIDSEQVPQLDIENLYEIEDLLQQNNIDYTLVMHTEEEG